MFDISNEWHKRIEEVLSDPLNNLIPRVPNAGSLQGGVQLMHNGIKVLNSGYYGFGITQMLFKNKGVHEPQEEYAFGLVLKYMPSGAVMVEGGSYWAFYSMWFNKFIPNAKNYMIEPAKNNLYIGKKNFKLNGINGNFTNAFIGKDVKRGFIPITTIDNFRAKKNIDFIHLLHVDIQGFEYNMLLGMPLTISMNKVGYIFISTHGSSVHDKCLLFLIEHEFDIVSNVTEKDTFSYDGLIIAKAKEFPGISYIPLSAKN